ncbi:MAG: hypothetical protein Q8934_14925 [Bacillota bacterium]|nr:hypothetical protein [Bacillota bacterium]
MVKNVKVFSLFMLLVLVLSACSNVSINKESKATLKTVKSVFADRVKKPNTSDGLLHFYLPSGYGIKDQTSNNILLKNGSNTYILFNNPEENTLSQVVYKASTAKYKKLQTIATFHRNKKFGFLLIKHLKDDVNELTVGIGGTKMTTQTSTENLKREAKKMMQIVNSVQTSN